MNSGDEIFKKAEGKVNKFFFKDYAEGYELFCRAGAAYKMEQNFGRAGEAYMRAGDCAMKEKNPHEACSAYTDSAMCLKRTDLPTARAAIKIAVDLNIEQNRLSSAARLMKDFGDALVEDSQPEEALEYYKKAFDWFSAEDQTQTAMGCLVKMGHILGEADRWEECVPLYEDVGKKYASGPLKHQAKEFFMRALLARFALVTNENRTEKCAEISECFESYLCLDPNFKHTREQEFCEALLEAVEENDVEKFDDCVATLHELKMLDDWKTHCLLTVKRNFEDIK